jgi:hypothetical protein
MSHPLQKRVLIPDGHWTRFRNEIFKNRLDLRNEHAASLYVFLYDRAYHSSSVPRLKASVSELARRSKLDLHEVKACTKELRENRLLRLRHHDSPEPVWKVPFADLKTVGDWFPVPRFIVRKYIPVYPDAVLLVLLLWYQNWRWSNDIYPGIRTLGGRLGWPDKRVKKAIFTMSDKREWKSLNAELPRPLKCFVKTWKNHTIMHYRVCAMHYDNKLQTLRLSKEWAKEFKVPEATPENCPTFYLS